MSLERRRGLQGGIDIGRFRIVVIFDAVQISDKFDAVLDARERRHGVPNGSSGAPAAMPSGRRHDIFHIVHAAKPICPSGS